MKIRISSEYDEVIRLVEGYAGKASVSGVNNDGSRFSRYQLSEGPTRIKIVETDRLPAIEVYGKSDAITDDKRRELSKLLLDGNQLNVEFA